MLNLRQIILYGINLTEYHKKLKHVKATICLAGLILITGGIFACMLWDDEDGNVHTSTITVSNEVQENYQRECGIEWNYL